VGGLQGNGRGHHDGDVEVDQCAQQRREDQDGASGNGPAAAGRDEHTGQDPERSESASQRRGEDNRGQGRKRPGGGCCGGGCGVRRQRGGADREDDAAAPDGDPERIVR
jgi:hypothetical protein